MFSLHILTRQFHFNLACLGPCIMWPCRGVPLYGHVGGVHLYGHVVGVPLYGHVGECPYMVMVVPSICSFLFQQVRVQCLHV